MRNGVAFVVGANGVTGAWGDVVFPLVNCPTTSITPIITTMARIIAPIFIYCAFFWECVGSCWLLGIKGVKSGTQS